jgi:NAD dependent epimerase/dehydratase
VNPYFNPIQKNDQEPLMGEFWKQKSVLVTGAGGFIGSFLVESLVQRGAHVAAFVRYNSRRDLGLLRLLDPDLLWSIQIIQGDLCDLAALMEAFKDVEFVFHLGALISIPYSYIHPDEVVNSNVIGTLNVLQACRETGVSRLVHTSSSEVYGTAISVPIDENHPLQGQSPYSASKIGADKLVESFYASYGVPAVTVRPFNTYGPRQSTRAVIPAIITQALIGSVIKLGNMEAVRDFTYITDTVDGLLISAEKSGLEGTTINLGTGQAVSIAELANSIGEIIGKPLEILVEPERLRPEKSEVQRLVSDNKLAFELLNWRPKVSLENGLPETITWYRENPNFYQSKQNIV